MSKKTLLVCDRCGCEIAEPVAECLLEVAIHGSQAKETAWSGHLCPSCTKVMQLAWILALREEKYGPA